jgi:hypothetical protein
VRPFPVVFDPPLPDLVARVVERDEDALVQALLAQPAVEALEAILLLLTVIAIRANV